MRRLLSRANRFLAPCAAINQLHGPAVKLGPLCGRELVRFGPNTPSSLAAPCLIGIFIVPSARAVSYTNSGSHKAPKRQAQNAGAEAEADSHWGQLCDGLAGS